MNTSKDLFFNPVLPEQFLHPNSKVTIVGTGAVGMACAVTTLSRTPVEIVLCDVVKDKLRGEVIDLNQAITFLGGKVTEAGDDYEATKDSDICVITAGARQREGESRLALLERNVSIFEKIVPKLVEKSPNTIIIVVSNPCDVLTYVTWKLSGLPQNRVFGSGTFIDSSRFRVAIAEEVGVGAQSVHGWIIGEHGDSSVPCWSGVNIASLPIHHPDQSSKWDAIYEKVKNSAYEVIKLKGYTCWAIGAAVANLVDCILSNSRRVVPISTLVKGYYDIKGDVFLSLPCVLGRNGVLNVIKQNLSEDELKKLHNSANTLNGFIEKLNLPNSAPK